MKTEFLLQWFGHTLFLILIITTSYSAENYLSTSKTHSFSFLSKQIGNNKIIAGVNSFPGEFPHQVSVQVLRPPILRGYHFCGGSILDETRILTAAHCLADLDADLYQLQVVAGSISIADTFSTARRKYNVKNIILHPHFDKITADNDLGIIVLSTPLNFTRNMSIRPLQLPPINYEPHGKCVVSGWGFQSTQSELNNRFSDILQKVSVDIVERQRCNEIYESVNYVTKHMICGGRLNEGMATCMGDSGSPVTCFLKDKTPYLAGIVSWGINPCGRPEFPSVFSNVASLRDFIDSSRF